MKIAGIDNSSPAIALYDNSKFHFHFFIKSPKKLPEKTEFEQFVLHPVLMPKKFDSQEQRFDFLSNWAINSLAKHNISRVCLEGYSFGSKSSSLFQIAEATSVLKNYLFKNKISFETIPPTTIKKFATGKGNAKKGQMEESFIEQTGIDIRKCLNQTEKQLSPSSDIVDSYFIYKYGQQTINENPQTD